MGWRQGEEESVWDDGSLYIPPATANSVFASLAIATPVLPDTRVNSIAVRSRAQSAFRSIALKKWHKRQRLVERPSELSTDYRVGDAIFEARLRREQLENEFENMDSRESVIHYGEKDLKTAKQINCFFKAFRL